MTVVIITVIHMEDPVLGRDAEGQISGSCTSCTELPGAPSASRRRPSP